MTGSAPHIVGARLRPVVNQPSPSPQPSLAGPEAHGTLIIGSRTFQVTHYRGNEQMGHDAAEWETIVAKVKVLLGQNIDLTQSDEVEISDRGVSSLTYGQQGSAPTRTPLNVDKNGLQSLHTALQTSRALPIASAQNTCLGSYDQNASPFGDGLGVNACTAIDLQFAEMALLGAPITSNLIDESVQRGQVKIAARRSFNAAALSPSAADKDVARAKTHYFGFADDPGFDNLNAGHINLPMYHPCLERIEPPHESPLVQNPNIPEQDQDKIAFYEERLNALLNFESSGIDETTPAVFAGITAASGGISFGIIVYRDPNNPHQASKVVYFDSHSNPLNGGRACAKTFNSIREASTFLAKRVRYKNPAEAPGIAHPNLLQITPFCLHEFFWARSPERRREIFDALPAGSNLREAIAFTVGTPENVENNVDPIVQRKNTRQARINNGEDQLQEHPEDRLIRATAENVLAALRERDDLTWPIDHAALEKHRRDAQILRDQQNALAAAAAS